MTSPSNFNLIAENLVEHLKKIFPEEDIIIRSYADDFFIIIRRPDFDLKKLIKEIEKWCKLQNMTLNKSKCGIIFHKHIPVNSISCNQDNVLGIPITENYKLLGVWIDKNLNFVNAINQIKQKSKTFLSRLYIYNSRLPP